MGQNATDVVLCRLLDAIDTAGFIPTLPVPHEVSGANRQFGCNKKAHLFGERRDVLIYYSLHQRLIWSKTSYQ